MTKTFLGTGENAVKSQIYVALINYLLLELVKRTISKTTFAFSNLSEKIRLCLYHYLSLNYVCNEVKEGARKITLPTQDKFVFKTNLFYNLSFITKYCCDRVIFYLICRKLSDASVKINKTV